MPEKEILIPCYCGNGHMYMSTIQDNYTGKAVMFILTEQEQIVFQGLCNYCGREFVRSVSLMDLLFKSIEDRRTQ